MHATPTAETASAGFELGPRLLGETADIDFDRRPHCRGQAHPLDVGALDAAWLAPSDRADKGAHIIDERVLRKARFADTGMDDPRLLGAELDLAAFDRLDGFGHVLRYRAETRVRHQPARPQDLPKPADHGHHVRCRDSAVEVDFAGLHLLGQVFPAAAASLARSPRANTATRTLLPVPCGSMTVPRRFWSGLRGSRFRFIAISTVSSNFAAARDLICLTASSSFTGGAAGSSPS